MKEFVNCLDWLDYFWLTVMFALVLALIDVMFNGGDIYMMVINYDGR